MRSDPACLASAPKLPGISSQVRIPKFCCKRVRSKNPIEFEKPLFIDVLEFVGEGKSRVWQFAFVGPFDVETNTDYSSALYICPNSSSCEARLGTYVQGQPSRRERPTGLAWRSRDRALFRRQASCNMRHEYRDADGEPFCGRWAIGIGRGGWRSRRTRRRSGIRKLGRKLGGDFIPGKEPFVCGSATAA